MGLPARLRRRRLLDVEPVPRSRLADPFPGVAGGRDRVDARRREGGSDLPHVFIGREPRGVDGIEDDAAFAFGVRDAGGDAFLPASEAILSLDLDGRVLLGLEHEGDHVAP